MTADDRQVCINLKQFPSKEFILGTLYLPVNRQLTCLNPLLIALYLKTG
jgi:hypothetical protein